MDFEIINKKGRLCGQSEGSGQPLLLVHGIACDSRFYAGVRSLLAKKYQVITYDRRGYSKSKAEEITDCYSIEAQTEDIKDVLDHCGIGQAIIVGTSAGGLLSLAFAERYPDYVKQLILYEPAVAITEADKKVLTEWLAELREISKKKRISRVFLAFISVLGGLDPQASPKPGQQLQDNMDNMKIFLDHEMEDFLTYEVPDQLQVPAVVGGGSLDQEGIFSSSAPANADCLGSVYRPAEGYHNFPEDRPDSFALWLEESIRSLS